MTMMTREEKLALFNKGKKEYEEKLKKENDKKNYKRDYEDIVSLPILDNEYQIIRFLDACLSPTSEERSPYGLKEIQRSCMVNDEGKYCFINWSYSKDWILWKVYNKVLEYTWDPNMGEKGGPIYHYQNRFPSLFEKIKYNGKPKEAREKWESGWRPKKQILGNIIDRKDKKFHEETKHSKLLCRKAKEKDGKISYPDPGFPPTIYTKHLYCDVIEDNGFLEDYDVGIKRIVVKTGDREETLYKVVHSSSLKNKEDLKGFIVDDLLTPEEEAYEKYDLDKLFPVSSYHKLMKNFGVFFQDVDKKMGTSFYVELERLVEEEKIKFDELYKNSETKEEVTEVANKELSVEEKVEEIVKEIVKEEEVKAEPVKENVRPTRAVKEVPVEESKEISLEEIVPFLKDLPDEEKKHVLDIGEAGVVFDKDSGTLYDCPECGEEQPEKIASLCIFCGKKFQ